MPSLINPNRFVPSFYQGHREDDGINAEVFFTPFPIAKSNTSKYYAIAYKGKSAKSVWHFSFKSEEAMLQYIQSFMERVKAEMEFNANKKAKDKELNASVTCEVGQIFKYSWGYDQTNVDYYQVTEVKGKKVTLRAIGAKTVNGTSGFMCCQVTPDKDNFLEGNMAETLTKIVKGTRYGTPTFSMQFGSLSLTSETDESYCSWYA